MFDFTVLFKDGTTTHISANDISEAYEKALDTFEKDIQDIWLD